jgi:hypothetical protein
MALASKSCSKTPEWPETSTSCLADSDGNALRPRHSVGASRLSKHWKGFGQHGPHKRIANDKSGRRMQCSRRLLPNPWRSPSYLPGNRRNQYSKAIRSKCSGAGRVLKYGSLKQGAFVRTVRAPLFRRHTASMISTEAKLPKAGDNLNKVLRGSAIVHSLNGIGNRVCAAKLKERSNCSARGN